MKTMPSSTAGRQSYHIEKKGDSNFVKACGVIGALAPVGLCVVLQAGISYAISPQESLNISNVLPTDRIGFVTHIGPLCVGGYFLGKYVGSKLEDCAGSLLGNSSTYNE